MTSDSVQVFRQCDLKQKDVSKSILRRDFLYDREKPTLNHNQTARKFKPAKKFQENKKSFKDTKIEDVFLNSEYFKHQSNNLGSLSFCSGDNGEHKWTIDSTFEMPSHQKNLKAYSYSDMIKNYAQNNNKSGSKDKNSVGPHLPDGKLKSQSCSLVKDMSNDDEKTGKFIEGILTGNGKIDKDLVTLITDQMFLAEKELQITRAHLIETISKLNERDLEIIRLQEKVSIQLNNLQKSEKKNSGSENSETSCKTSEDYQRLILASEKLKKQVKDMEEFLNDYGLIWIGDKESNLKPDFDKIIKNFQRLNSIASQPKIIQTTLGAKFELPKEISIVLYSNGILLRGNDFREYSKISTSLFLQDVEDGYFPSELQSEYPDGVPFEVTDKRNEAYKIGPKIEVFKGIGNRLGSNFEDKPASVVFLEPVKECKSHGSCTPGTSFDSSERSGKKCVKKRSKPHQENSLRHPGLICNRDSSDNSIPESTDKVCNKTLTLKIRFGKNRTESFVLLMHENDRLSKFHECLQQKLCERYHEECLVSSGSKIRPTDFEIHVYGKNTFRLIDNLHMRLKDYGITHNCVINVWEI